MPNGWVSIVSKNSGKCIQVQSDSTASAAVLIQATCANIDSQKWKFSDAKAGYKIISKRSGLAMDVAGASTVDGGYLIQYPYYGTLNQNFVVLKTSDGYASIMCVYSRKMMDVTGVSKADGATIQQWQSNNGDNQKWSFIPTR